MQQPASRHVRTPLLSFGPGDATVAEMGAYLARARPQSAAEALRMLRNAYPDAKLERRVAACGHVSR